MSETIYRGEQAERILSDPLVKAALSDIAQATRDLFFDLPPEAREQREFLHLMDRARQQFEGYFIKLICGAKVEKSEILAESHMRASVEAARRAANVR